MKTVLELLEKTHLLFHLEAYGNYSNRNRKAWNYYFATSSIKYALSSYIGNVTRDKEKIEGILLENMVASKLYDLSDNNYNFRYTMVVEKSQMLISYFMMICRVVCLWKLD